MQDVRFRVNEEHKNTPIAATCTAVIGESPIFPPIPNTISKISSACV